MAKASVAAHTADGGQAAHDPSDADPAPPAALSRIDMPTLVADHHAAVYRYARRLAGCPVQAEDLTQQTFLIAQQKLGQIRDASRAAAWLLAIARNCFLKSRRRLEPAAAAAMGLDIEQVPGRGSASDSFDREALDRALAELADEFRLVLLMFYFEELSYQQIAAQLDLPLGTVMSRLSRAKRHLRAKLAPPAADSAQPSARHALRAAVPSLPANAAP